MLPSRHAPVMPRMPSQTGSATHRRAYRSKGGGGMRFRRAGLALALPVALAVAALLAAAANSRPTAPPIGSGKQTARNSVCGLGTGKKATGPTIKIGAIATKQPGTDFTDIPNMAKAYFDCVNNNGGINGHPIKYYIATEQTNPAQVAPVAKQLVQTNKV